MKYQYKETFQNTCLKWILLLFVFQTPSFLSNAQNIPNGSFENWTEISGVDTPENWQTSDQLDCNPLSAIQSSGASDGNVAILLETSTCAGAGGVHEGYVLTNFQESAQPLYFNFDFKSYRPNNDTALVKIFVRQGSTTIGAGSYSITSNASDNYVSVSVPISYATADLTDNISIQFFSDKYPTNTLGNKLWVDNLSFSALPIHIESTIADKSGFLICPNPAGNFLSLINLESSKFSVVIYDMQGKKHIQQDIYQSIQKLDIQTLEIGMYALEIVDGQKRKFLRFVKE